MSTIDASTTVKRDAVGAAASAMTAANARMTTLVLICRCGRAQRTTGLLQKVRLDERIEIAVEHPIDVANLHLRAVILDHLIRLQHVAANLAAEPNLFLR